MTTLVLVSLVFAVCYLLARPVFSNRWQLLGFRQLFLSGGEFLLVGYLVGPRGLGLIGPSVAAALDPVLHLGVGWAGLIFGLQFNRRFLVVYPLPRYIFAFVQAIVTGCLAGGAALWLVPRLFPEADRVAVLRIALLVGLTAAPTSPASLHYFSDLFGIRGRVNRLLRFVAGVDGIPSVLVLGLVSGFFHVWAGTTRSASPFDLAGWQWMLVETLLGIVLGLLLVGLVELQIGREERLLFVLGMVILAGGLAHYLQLSALFVSFVMGLLVANGAWHREEVHKVAAYAEKPIYLTLLVLAGSNLALDDWRVPALALAIVALRLVGKMVGNLGWPMLGSEPEAQSPWLGLALLPQGALCILLAIDVLFFFRHDVEHLEAITVAASAVIVGALLNEVLSPVLLRLASPAPMWRRRGSAG